MDMDKLVSLCKRRGFIFPSSEIYGGINGFWDYGPLGVELKRNIKEAWWSDNVSRHDDLTVRAGAPGTYEMVGLDCSIIMNPKVWVASGHVGGFSDPMVDCRSCKSRFRADQVMVIVHHLKRLKGEQPEPFDLYFCGVGSFDEVLAAHQKDLEKTLSKPGVSEAADAEWFALDRQGIDESTYAKVPCPSCKETATLTQPRAFNLMFRNEIGAVVDESSEGLPST